MIHPSQLLRANSERSPFEATRSENPLLSENDCGIVLMPCLAQRLHLQKFYKITIFIAFLTSLLLLHSTCTSYFIGTAKVWRRNYNLSETVTEWAVFLSPILSGVFGALFAYYGDAIHRTSCVGAVAMMHATAGWLLIVPEVYHPHFGQFNSSTVADQLCRQRLHSPALSDLHEEFDEGKKFIALSVIILYQLMHALSLMAFFSLGIAYIDDGCTKFASTRNVCIVVAGWQIGKYIGLNSTLIPITFNRYIFFSFAWLTLMSLLLIFGFLISLFPKYPKRVVVGHGVDLILRRNRAQSEEMAKKSSYLSTIATLMKSPLMIINIASATLMNTATINLSAMREEFYRARFVQVGDDFDYRFSFFNVSQMLFVCLVVAILAGVIEKRRPTTKFYVLWICIVYVLIFILFVSHAFIKCDDAIDVNYNSLLKGCNGRCGCTMDVFSPVCLDGKTYYSACFAGCLYKKDDTYLNCSCANGQSLGIASEGICNKGKCFAVSFMAEANGVISAGLQISAFIIHVVLSLRTIEHPSQKSTAIGLFLSSFLLLPFIPFKLFYEFIKGALCRYNVHHECVEFKTSFALTISLMTSMFMLLAIILAFCMLPFAKQVHIYKRGAASMVSGGLETTMEEDTDSDDAFVAMPVNQRNGRRMSSQSSPSSHPASDGYSVNDIDEELKQIGLEDEDKAKKTLQETQF